MTKKFSKTTLGFYIEGIHGNIPEDCIEISEDLYRQIIDGQSQSKLISVGSDGMPYLSDYVEVPVIPSFVTRAQGKTALIRAGLWQGVVEFVNSITDPVEKAVAEVALNDTTNWQRSSPFLNSAAHAIGLTDEQLDQLFIDASKIEL